ncbi:MAG: type II secretion system GspH family protein [Proteobacteria bacterium]|nr:type II secretion system GspH family protein [Pseudomonadota bacterium]
MSRPIHALRGFTLLELAVSMMIIALLTTVLGNTFMPWVHFRQAEENETRLRELAGTLSAAYDQSSLSVDGQAGARLDFLQGVVMPSPADGSGRCTSTAASFLPVAAFSSRSATTLYQDGYHQPFCVLVTPRLFQRVDGVQLDYHDVALVSAGANGHLDSGRCHTYLDAATGQLFLCGDDTGIRVDGFALALAHFRLTVLRMNRIVRAMEDYFATRYEMDPSRDVAIDYFASTGPNPGRWDQGGTMPSSGCLAPLPLTGPDGANPQVLLGLSRTDVTDAYGQVMTVDNCSNAVRSPANTRPDRAVAPYTARIQTILPGGVILAETAVSQF